MKTNDDKAFKICNIPGGLDVTRFVSANTRRIFQGAIEDVELIREYVSLAMENQGIVGGVSDLAVLNNSLDWKARGIRKGTTTVEAGLGYVDDRIDKVIDRYVGLKQEPFIGDKQSDMKIVDTLSNLLPWIVDRRSTEKSWYTPHQNGRSEGDEKESYEFDSLYAAAWIGSYGNAWLYYPPLTVFTDGHPMTSGDIIGGDFETHDLPYIKPNLPENNPKRRAFFRSPYPDVAQPGLSLISAIAPVYFTGSFDNYTYNETYIASAGVDIAVLSTSNVLDILLDQMTASSFAIIIDMNFNAIVISQAVVERLYPKLTGFEKARVTYNIVDGSTIEDRRNQTYLVSDTIYQSLLELENANWSQLQQDIIGIQRGNRGLSLINMTITGEVEPKEFHVLYERWSEVADWAMLVFLPTDELDHAIDVRLYDSKMDDGKNYSELSGEQGVKLSGEAILKNAGGLDVLLNMKSVPGWFQVAHSLQSAKVKSGEILSFEFSIETSELSVGVSSFLLTFDVHSDGYPDCFYNQGISLAVQVTVSAKDCAALTGDAFRAADNSGKCVCMASTVEMGGSCIRYSILFPVIFIITILLGFIGIIVFLDRKRKQSDSIWLINRSDLIFDDYPEVLGRGTFGLVVKAEYRGTQVAVKRVIPPLKEDAKDEKNSSHYSRVLGPFASKLNLLSGRTQTSFLNHFDFGNTSQGENSCRRSSMRLGSDISLINGHFLDSKGIESVDVLNLTKCNASQYAKLKLDFIREMRLLSKLRHPCITTVMGAVIGSGEEPLLVMELMDHGSLFDLLHNETMVVEGDIVLPILQDIAQGLRFLHAASPQVIHGDLKALNVLVDSKFRAKVADFGLSQKKGVGAAGTPFWMAPELLSGKSKNTAASDVYSFGIILYEVYSRKVPYEGEDFEETIREICDFYINKRPPVPATMPKEIVVLMTACTNAHPDIRPTFHDIDNRLRSFNAGIVQPSQIYFSWQSKKHWDTTMTPTENLLLEIFPPHVADALCRGQKVEPQHFDCVTIFFSDIVGFTSISAELSPLKVSDMLDRLYIKFDQLSRIHEVFKVETIGDAWMGVTNVVTQQSDHTKRIAAFALDAIQEASNTLVDEDDPSRGYVKIRIGFHSGPVIANVVGSRNPKYTLIGDTVNTSSRMESNSQAGRILCSPMAAKLLQEQAPDIYMIEARELIHVKGKGYMETFWISEATS
jgi:serine/threonine protein kinase